MTARQGTSMMAEMKQNRMPITQAKPKVTIGDILEIINEPNPIIVVIVERNTAFPVDFNVISIL